MDEELSQLYLSLIQELLDCVTEEEADILSANLELVDEGLVEVMRFKKPKKWQNGGRGSPPRWLWNFAGKVEAADYSVPQLQKAEADRLRHEVSDSLRGICHRKSKRLTWLESKKQKQSACSSKVFNRINSFNIPKPSNLFNSPSTCIKQLGISAAWQTLGECWELSSNFGATGRRPSVCIGNLWN